MLHPRCNSRWAQGEGSEVWCDDGRVPRMLFDRASKRCACYTPDEAAAAAAAAATATATEAAAAAAAATGGTGGTAVGVAAGVSGVVVRSGRLQVVAGCSPSASRCSTAPAAET